MIKVSVRYNKTKEKKEVIERLIKIIENEAEIIEEEMDQENIKIINIGINFVRGEIESEREISKNEDNL